ncbi:MAG: TonB-dependent receptor [Candidatus Eisenbacteria bacterium]|nr:TonB-dependent receptor [Candidatus Eisenbacteria bacterium]
MNVRIPLRTVSALALALATAGPAARPGFAQDADSVSDLMQLSLEQLTRVTVVSAARHAQRRIDSPRSVSVITSEDLRRGNFRTVPEALVGLAGVLVQETNYGGGSPVIRGLIGNQVLILVDGVRMNNGFYRLGPNQYLNTIDIAQVERIEVIHGTGSTLYGSDALGGIVNILTRDAHPGGSSAAVRSGSRVRAATADRSLGGRLEFSSTSASLGVVGGIGARSFGDLRAGSLVGRQAHTGYHELDGDLKLEAALAPRARATAALQYVRQSDLPRTDMVAPRGDHIRYDWSPEERILGYLHLGATRPWAFADTLSLRLSYHVQGEQVERVLASAPTVTRHYLDRVKTWGLAVQASSRIGAHQLFTYGSEAYRDRITSSRTDHDDVTGAGQSKRGTVLDQSSYRTVAVYVQDELQVSEALHVTLGLRQSWIDLDAYDSSAAPDSRSINLDPSALTGSVHALYRISHNVHLVGGVGQGFRAPSLNDGTVVGTFGGGYEVPSPRLQPEHSVDYEVGIKAQRGGFAGTLFYYLSDIHDLIERRPTTQNGLPFLDSNGNGVQDPGEPLVFDRQNQGRARVHGIEAKLEVLLRHDVSGYANLGWTRGSDPQTDEPMRRIPPVMGAAGLKWLPSRTAWAELYSLFGGTQARLAPGDLTDPRMSPHGTPGYVTLNVRGGMDLGRAGRLTLGLENLLDKTYRYHGSGMDAPGFNVVLGYGVSLAH